MPSTPTEKTKSAVAFIDGQNLFHCAKEAFGIADPNYDVKALSELVCAKKGWSLAQTRFYTGVPEAHDKPEWNQYWSRKILSMKRNGVWVFTRKLRKRTKSIEVPGFGTHSFDVFEEKGIDVKIALDLIALTHQRKFDVALIFSQDQDLSEAVLEIQSIANTQGRKVWLASAFPVGRDSKNLYGINRTESIAVIESDYNSCLDKWDYWKSIRSPGP